MSIIRAFSVCSSRAPAPASPAPARGADQGQASLTRQAVHIERPLCRGRAAVQARACNPREDGGTGRAGVFRRPEQSGRSLSAAGPLRRSRAAVPALARDPREEAWRRQPRHRHRVEQSRQPAAAAGPLRRRRAALPADAGDPGEVRGPAHPDVASALNNLAELTNKQARYAEAEPLYRRALAIRQKALRPDDPDVATSYNNLAGFYALLGRYGEAEQLSGSRSPSSRKRSAPSIPMSRPI